MYSTVRTAVLDGISAIPVQVEVDISTGMPVFDMVGNLTSEVREAKAVSYTHLTLPTIGSCRSRWSPYH